MVEALPLIELLQDWFGTVQVRAGENVMQLNDITTGEQS